MRWCFLFLTNKRRDIVKFSNRIFIDICPEKQKKNVPEISIIFTFFNYYEKKISNWTSIIMKKKRTLHFIKRQYLSKLTTESVWVCIQKIVKQNMDGKRIMTTVYANKWKIFLSLKHNIRRKIALQHPSVFYSLSASNVDIIKVKSVQIFVLDKVFSWVLLFYFCISFFCMLADLWY